jgi:hypothetical protein
MTKVAATTHQPWPGRPCMSGTVAAVDERRSPFSDVIVRRDGRE